MKKYIRNYLERIAARDWSDKVDLLGVRVDGKTVEIDFFNTPFTITPAAIADSSGNKPRHAVSVVLCQYLLLCPTAVSRTGELVTYNDFKDAAPHAAGFMNAAEKPISRHFSGRPAELEERCRRLGGKPFSTVASYQLTYELPALPRVPIYLFFNDRDEEFAASCNLLFQKNASQFLDGECIADGGNHFGQMVEAIRRAAGTRGVWLIGISARRLEDMTRILLAIIAFYRRWLSPALHTISPGGCRYLPTCSEYAATAIATHGPLRGCALAAWRLLALPSLCPRRPRSSSAHPSASAPVPPRRPLRPRNRVRSPINRYHRRSGGPVGCP